MDRTQKLTAASLAVLAVAIAYLKWRGHPSVSTGEESAAQDPFLAPYSYSTPGIADDPVILNGGAPFQSTVNVSVNPSYLGTLSQQFIPLFGFVGMPTGMASNVSLAQSSSSTSAPSAYSNTQTHFASPSASISSASSNFNQPNPFSGRKTWSATNNGPLNYAPLH